MLRKQKEFLNQCSL